MRIATLMSLGSNTMMMAEESGDDWYDCALRSIGIEAAVKFFSDGASSAAKSSIKKKVLRKMVTKIATRTLGVVGAAIAVYEFGDCMDWW